MKKKIIWISDHPMVPSGVGTQSRLVIEGLLETGNYKFICLGGAIRHPDYTPQKIYPEKYGDDWIVLPVDGYGNEKTIREVLMYEKPDAIVIFTDPRFFTWLWSIEDEIRAVCPIVYWHVWDNDPHPDFNKVFYDSTDLIASLSLKTHGLLNALKVPSTYIPHAIDPAVFYKKEVDTQSRENYLGPHCDKEFVVFWNNRNARRKQTGDVVAAFSKFMKIVGKSKTALFMHTAPNDPEGQDIFALSNEFGIAENLVISDGRIDSAVLNDLYNVSDVTINISSAEGFGLSTLESLMTGTPIIAHCTGGLQFQVGDWWNDRNIDDEFFTDQDTMTDFAKHRYSHGIGNWWGVPVFPASRSCTGSQQVPYIYDDRVCHEDVVNAMLKLFNMPKNKREAMGIKASNWAKQHFSLNKMISDWDKLLQQASTLKRRVNTYTCTGV